ncbi:MAG: bifunctional phosphoribosylaminoimidazolecarboxamide formyltransferase/IMP cyclohydrolase [Bryobacteraceae bacterium]|nr:bifunctional phosphoribosylaminoimidazolecarboxamide formyltransferase/IMP cyclohydrolase [Bryobacteraceae bacterium]
MIARALLSVTNKTGLVDFARSLHELGVELVSTGGTAQALATAGIPVRDVSDVTGFPEMMDGRLKTIHPKIAGGMLARRDQPSHLAAMQEHGIPAIDLVVVNLYDFEGVAADAGATIERLIENIDIGGPTMIRAAAKNYESVGVVTSPEDYPRVIAALREHGSLPATLRWELARKAFARTAAYDRAISARLAVIDHETSLDLLVPKAFDLRYGENPHQSAALYSTRQTGIAGAAQLQGKELSYNNLVDLDAAWQLILEFTELPACAIIKHTNPCGCAEAATLAEAYSRALEADPVSAFGGVLAFNRPLDAATATEVAKLFTEAIAAPGYSDEALAILGAKKNLRVLRVASSNSDEPVVKSISGGYLVQTADRPRLLEARVVTDREPTPEEWHALRFGWKVVKHLKSNAILYARPGQAISAGAGQMSRVDSVKVGAMKSHLPLAGAVIASDAFFPFPDGLEEAAKHGITAAIQPGGSVKDPEVIATANRLGLAMVFTGVRHFRH